MSFILLHRHYTMYTTLHSVVCLAARSTAQYVKIQLVKFFLPENDDRACFHVMMHIHFIPWIIVMRSQWRSVATRLHVSPSMNDCAVLKVETLTSASTGTYKYHASETRCHNRLSLHTLKHVEKFNLHAFKKFEYQFTWGIEIFRQPSEDTSRIFIWNTALQTTYYFNLGHIMFLHHSENLK
jgi:hypothetical protein